MDIELLQPERLDAWGKRLIFPADAIGALQAIASLVRDDPALGSAFAEFHERTALKDEWHRDWSKLPFDEGVQARLGDRTSLFYLLAYMAGLPYTEDRYRQLGIGTVIFDDTMKDFLIYMGDFYDLHGYWGYAQFMWIWRHLTCELFRLGRLQYMLAPFFHGVTAFRRKASAPGVSSGATHAHAIGADGDLPDLDILLLADPDQLLRSDGYAFGAGRRAGEDAPPGDDTWKPIFAESPAGWRGNVVSPYGFVLPQAVFLPRTEWDIALQFGDTVLDVHIPRKDPLNVETCRDSYLQALEFFPRVKPDRPWKALFCHTWFFTPQLQTILPTESSIVKFQREFYLYPFQGNVGFLWSFVFGEKYPDPAGAPRDTSLRRNVLAWLEQGKEIFDLPGVMFHRPEAWGSQPYMSGWDVGKGEAEK